MKKLMIVLTILLALSPVMSTAGCSSDDEATKAPALTAAVTATATPEPAEKGYTGGEHTFKISHGGSTTSFGHLQWQYIDERLRYYTDGKVKLEIFPMYSLYTAFEEWDAVVTGACDIAGIADYQIQMAGFLDFQIPWLNFFWGATRDETMEHDRRFWEHPEGGGTLLSQVEPRGMKLVAAFPSDPQQVIIADFEMKSVFDIKDRKIPSVGGMSGLVLDHAGAKHMPLDVSEWALALQQHLVDCISLGAEAVRTYNLYEVAGYVFLFDPIAVHTYWAMNLELWDSLSPELQDIILNKVVPEVTDWIWEKIPENNQANLDYLEEVGVTYYYMPQDERIAARDAIWEMTKEKGILSQMDEDLVRLADCLREEPYDQGCYFP